MTALMRIELLKLRTTPAPWVALGLTALLVVSSVLSSILLAGTQGAPPAGSVVRPLGTGFVVGAPNGVVAYR